MMKRDGRSALVRLQRPAACALLLISLTTVLGMSSCSAPSQQTRAEWADMARPVVRGVAVSLTDMLVDRLLIYLETLARRDPIAGIEGLTPEQLTRVREAMANARREDVDALRRQLRVDAIDKADEWLNRIR